MILPEFELLRPSSIDEALAQLRAHKGDVRVVAGGTDLLPSMKQGLFSPRYVLSLRGLNELRGVKGDGLGGWRIAAATTLRAIIGNEELAQALPALIDACRQVGTPLVQARATLGGNLLLDTRCLFYNQTAHWRASLGGCLKKEGDICHVAPGSPICLAAFSSDTAPVLLALSALVEIADAGGRRLIPLSALYAPGDGARWLNLARDALLVAIHIPPQPAARRVTYLKGRLRRAIDFPLVAVAASVEPSPDGPTRAWIHLTAVDTAPISADVSQALIHGCNETALAAAAALAIKGARPLGTHAVSVGYRLRLTEVLCRRALALAF